MLLMWAPIHHLLLLSTKMPMGILHCLWATTWSVFAVPVLEGVGRVLFTYFTFIFDLRAGLEKLCWGLQKPCFNMASKTTLRLCSSWMCCRACFWGAPSWLCSVRGWETHRGCGVWGANHMGVIRCLPMGMLYLPSSERLTAVHGTSCPKRTVWAEAQEDIGVACTASIRDSATRKASIPCVKLWKRMDIVHIRVRARKLGCGRDDGPAFSCTKARRKPHLSDHSSFVRGQSIHTREPCIPPFSWVQVL